MILSTKGWGHDEFRNATPDFLAAARFALFAERVAPLLAQAEEVAALPRKGLTPDQIRAKVAGAEALPVFRAVLYPEDEPIG